MDTNNWRPSQGAEPSTDSGDWRAQLQPESRERIVRKIMDILNGHPFVSDQEGSHELRKIAQSFEEDIFTTAISQIDYLRKISLKMLTMETKSQGTMANDVPSNQGPLSKKHKISTPFQLIDKQEKKLKEVEHSLSQRKEECDRLKQDLKKTEEQKKQLEVGWNKLLEEKEKLSVDQESLKGQLHAFKLKAVEEFNKGFGMALAQVRVLHPDIDITGIDINKVVIDGQITLPPNQPLQESVSIPTTEY